MVNAQTKRFTKSAKKTVNKASGTAKGAAKTLSKKAPNPVRQAKQAGGSRGGAQNWYGPDRALFLGEHSQYG